ncbi:hypothetical protein [Streptomyces sp. URMC 123]|uniref:hypothetical protein n=1 Tax=Streptomyces sp. URMC 123 TaxID=3423403 RepID=UPI003F1B3207
MTSQEAAPRSRSAAPGRPPEPPEPIGVEQAEAALVEHYPRLVRMAYLVLPPELGRNRRVLTAHAVAQRAALPRSRADAAKTTAPPQPGATPGYAFVRLRILRAALDAGRPRGRWELPGRDRLPPLLPQVWGLRLFPRSGGADELALDQALSALSAPARAAYALRGLEGLPDHELREVLAAAGVEDPRAALLEADAVRTPPGSRDGSLLDSAEFDPCSLQARPTDLVRRRQHVRAATAAAVALVACTALLGLPGDTWGPDGAAAPPYARNAAAERALDPALVTRAAADTWRTADRLDFAAWPARGERTDDTALLRRALAVWARPGATVQVTSTPGTPTGPAAGPPQLLYAGDVDGAAVVLLHDGLRVVRYAEALGGDDDERAVALDFARADGASAATATAIVVGRTDGNVRYLTAPWVTDARARDLLRPEGAGQALRRTPQGVTDPLPSTAARAGGDCGTWPALELRTSGPGTGGVVRLATDLGELTPAQLTYGAPDAAPRDASGAAARAGWARTACHLPAVRSSGVRAVNAWQFASQTLPGGDGTAAWVCTRAETWRGTGTKVLALFQAPGPAAAEGAPGAPAAVAENTAACGAREPRVLSGVLWKSRAGAWYLLAAGSEQVSSISLTGGVRGTARGRLLTVPARPGSRAVLTGTLADGTRITALR